MEEFLPKGFLGAVASAAIKKPGRMDMGLIYSEKKAVAAGVFTQNKVKAAPVLIDMERLKKGTAQAILVNSGNANACTGSQGLEDALVLSRWMAKELSISEEDLLLASTGVIGQRLPLERMGGVIPELARNLSRESLPLVAEAIMTTDTFPKISHKKATLRGVDYTIYAMAKGAGMIMPNMATMLCFVLTDLAIEERWLKSALSKAIDKSFNRITVDGDTSTNDMVLILANGLLGDGELSFAEISDFESALTDVLRKLAALIVKDGEGATKLVNIRVSGARNDKDAEIAARTVANSLLVKTALFGEDPNWGRIMAALGRSGCNFDPDKVKIAIGNIQIVENGVGLGLEAEEKAKARMKEPQFEVDIYLSEGKGTSEILTCDLSYEYVKINAEYRT